jgi:hypothetical protein
MAQVCVGDSAYISAATSASLAILGRGVADLAVSVALSTWRRNVAKKINDMKAEIADRQVAMAEAAQGHAASFYPAEAALLAEAMSMPKTTPDYGLASGWTTFSTEANNFGRQSWLKASRALCMPPSMCDDGRWSTHMRANEVDTGNYAMRQAENRSQALNDVRFKKQLDAIAVGQGKLGSGAGYSMAAGAITESVGTAFMNSVNSAAQLVGFAMTKKAIKPQWEYGYEPKVLQQGAPRQNNNVLSGGPSEGTYNPTDIYMNYEAVKMNSARMHSLYDTPNRGDTEARL